MITSAFATVFGDKFAALFVAIALTFLACSTILGWSLSGVVAYAFYAQLTGKAVTEVGIDAIPTYLRHSSTQHLGDMAVTGEMKQVILNTVDYTLNNPWAVPGH